MTAPAPGWYPDPYGKAKQRYWDGALWTGHVSGAADAAPTTAPPTQPEPAGPGFTSGASGSRMGNRRTLFLFLGAFAVVVIGGALAISLLGRGDPAADCPPDRICSEPPAGAPLVNLSVWRSADLGFGFEYDDDSWKLAKEDGARAVLEHRDLDMSLIISGAPADLEPQEAADQVLEDIGANLTGLTEDTDSADQVYGPSLGYVDGVGDAYTGGVDTPQGLVEVSLVVMAARQGDVTAAATVITGHARPDDPSEPDLKDASYARADSVLNSFTFSSEEAR